MENKRKSYDSDISHEQWELIKDLASLPARKTGRKRVNQQEAFNACLYVLYTGCRWNDIPHDFGVSKSVAYDYLKTLKKKKRLSKIFECLKQIAHKAGKISLHNAYLDASVVKSKRGDVAPSAIQENTGLLG